MARLHEELARAEPAWCDEQARRALLASFAQPRDVNPEAHDARASFWRRALRLALRRGHAADSVFVLPAAEDMSRAFALPDGARPLGLAHVYAAMVADGELQPLAPPDSADTLAARLSRLLVSGYRWLRASEEDEEDAVPHGPVASVRLLAEAAEGVVREAPPRAMSFGEFSEAVQRARRVSGDAPISDDGDWGLLLAHMERAGTAAVLRAPTRAAWVVRVSPPGALMQDDVEAVRMRQLAARLRARADDLDALGTRERAAAACALERNDRALALHALRRARAAHTARDARLASLSQLEDVLAAIDSAETSAAVHAALLAGHGALRAAVASVGGDASTIAATLDAVRDLVGEAGEIGAALASPLSEGTIDEGALERELERMLIPEALAGQAASLPATPGGAENTECVDGTDEGTESVDGTKEDIITREMVEEMPSVPSGEPIVEASSGDERVATAAS